MVVLVKKLLEVGREVRNGRLAFTQPKNDRPRVDVNGWALNHTRVITSGTQVPLDEKSRSQLGTGTIREDRAGPMRD
jgi:hypothetical protein